MKFNLIEKTVESGVAVSAARNSPSLNISGCDSIVFQMTLSAPSSPNTATIQLFGSIDDTNFTAVGSTVAVSAAASYIVSTDRPLFKYYRVQYAIASGSYTAALKVLAKGDKE